MDVGAVEEDWGFEGREEDVNNVGVRCHRCGGLGHMMRECPTKLKGKSEGKGVQRRKEKATAKIQREKDRGHFLVYAGIAGSLVIEQASATR